MIQNEIIENFSNCEIVDNKIVVHQNIAKIIDFVKTKYHFDILKEIIAVDKIEEGIELIYNLYSTENEESVLISIIVKDETDSVSQLFDSAIADEKEIFDLFGIKFIGNNELKRLYMPETWKGHPLKKDYTESDERLSWNDK